MSRIRAVIGGIVAIALLAPWFATGCLAQDRGILSREILVKRDLLGDVVFLGFDVDNNVIEQRDGLLENPDTGTRSWNIRTGKANWLIPDDGDRLVVIGLSPDGKILASCKAIPKAANAGMPKSELRLFRTSNGEHVYLINREHFIDNFAFDAKGARFVFHQFTIRDEFQFWSVEKKGDLLQAQELVKARSDKVFDEAAAIFQGDFSPDLTRLAAPMIVFGTVPLKFYLRQWDVRKEKILWTTKEPMSFACRPSYSPCGKWIVGSLNDNTTRIWDAETGIELRKITHLGDGKKPRSPRHAISRDSKWLATATRNEKSNEVVIWNLATAKKLLTIPVEQGRIGAVAFNQRGDLLAAGSMNALHVWELSVPKEPKK